VSRINWPLVLIGALCGVLVALIGLAIWVGGGTSCPEGYEAHSESKVTWGIDLTTGQYKPIMHTESYCLPETP
jgi:hypothetical protein